MLTGDISGNWVGLAGVLVAGLSSVLTLVVARSNRRHERQMALDARVYERRSLVYAEMLKAARLRLVIVGPVVEHLVRQQPIPEASPAVPSKEELAERSANVAAFGSAEVVKLLDSFEAWSAALGDMLVNQVIGWDQKSPEGRLTSSSAIRQLSDDCWKKLAELEEQARTELTELPKTRAHRLPRSSASRPQDRQ